MTPSLSKEVVGLAPARATPRGSLQELSEVSAPIEPSNTPGVVSEDVAHARKCRPVRKCTRLVPAKVRNLADAGNITSPFAGLFRKPSDGLEPSTPSLPSRFRGGNRGHDRASAVTFFLQIGASGRLNDART